MLVLSILNFNSDLVKFNLWQYLEIVTKNDIFRNACSSIISEYEIVKSLFKLYVHKLFITTVAMFVIRCVA